MKYKPKPIIRSFGKEYSTAYVWIEDGLKRLFDRHTKSFNKTTEMLVSLYQPRMLYFPIFNLKRDED